MSKKINFYKIGAFVLAAIVALLIFVVVLGSHHFSGAAITVETYFNQSVQGLQKGSPVKFRGITVGQITSVNLLSEIYSEQEVRNPDIDHRYIYVGFALTSNSLKNGDTFLTNLPEKIKQGLRVLVSTESLAGNSYLEIAYVDPTQNPVLPITWTPKNLYIPSAASVMSDFISSTSEVLDDLQQADISSFINHADQASVSLNQAIADADIKNMSQETQETLRTLKNTAQEYAQLAQTLQHILSDTPISNTVKDIDALTHTLNDAANTAQFTLSHINATLTNLDAILAIYRAQADTVASNAADISNNLREFSQNAKAYPAQTLFGSPPPPLNPGTL